MGNYKLKELLRWRRPKQHGHLGVAPRRRRLDRAETLNLKVWALEIRHQKVTEKSIEGKGNKMKITTQQLKQIIKEEKAKIIKEQRGDRREALDMLEEFEAMGISGSAIAEYLVGNWMTGDDAFAAMADYRDEL